jgi:prepilin-type processing-associated H-X9-DG protein
MPPPGNFAATAAVVSGALLFVPFLTGILAIVVGRRGLEAAAETGAGRFAAKWGIGLGIANVAIWTLSTPLIGYAMYSARQQSLLVACMANMRSIGQAVTVYTTQNKGYLPISLDEVVNTGVITPAQLECPAATGDPSRPPLATLNAGPTHYQFVETRQRQKVKSVRVWTETVMAYESPLDHPNRGSAFLYYDGHVEVFPNAAATRAIAELKAGQNPPPALRGLSR